MARRPRNSVPATAREEAERQPLVAEFDRRVDVAAAARRKIALDFEIAPAERAAIARYLGLVSLDALTGAVTVRPWRQGFALEGHFEARVVQTCVVTLDPVTADIAQDFERFYLPPEALASERRGKEADAVEIEVDAAEGEVPEELAGQGIPLGDVLVEELSLALDSFPRAPDAEVNLPAEGEAPPHPFAVLAKLRRDD
jgi:uncharacterized metal-binding protein YceD (DUF177 family)